MGQYDRQSDRKIIRCILMYFNATRATIVLKKGQFYFIYEGNDCNPTLILEDKTKRGLEVTRTYFDDKYGVESEKGIIYDMDGIGHRVGIRWYFPKTKYSLKHIVKSLKRWKPRYKTIREMTCPDDEAIERLLALLFTQ